LADATDAWLEALFDDATAGDPAGLALVAAGGYGRGELAPGSDLDVWLLHDGRADVTEVASRVWYPIWDAGLKLGHSVGTVREVLALAGNDLDAATAALSARHLAGDDRITWSLRDRAHTQWQKRSARWLPELDRRVRERHAAAGEVAFLLEPNIKEGRGGLRDVHALAWAEQARHALSNGDPNALRDAEDVLLDVRVALHRLLNRPSDELVLERQDAVAEALEFSDADELMAHVSAAARTIAWISDEAWLRLRSSLNGPLGRVFRRDRDIGRDLVLRDLAVHVEASADVPSDPSLVLRAAHLAAEQETYIDRGSLDRLTAEAPALGRDGTWPDDARDALVGLLATGHRAIPVLESLDQRHLLERMLPEWAPLRSRPQRNALHRFTVDRHLCEAAAEAASLAKHVRRPDLLLVGTWLHDIGKGHPGDHTDVGIVMVDEITRRMGFAPDDVATMVAMVRHHLLLSEIATRRDLSDEDVIRSVEEQVGTVDMLQLLAALTEADSRATGPAAWSAWKAELVGELVEKVAAALRGEDPLHGVARDGFPDAGVRALMHAQQVAVRYDPPQITVVAPDRVGTFSRVAGTLALRGLTVLSAEAASHDGMAASRFRVDGNDPALDWQRIATDIDRALRGRLAIDARLAERRSSHRSTVRRQFLGRAPSVRVDNQASGTSTVIEVRAPDRIGVLYRITRAFAELDLDIRSAKVATMGDEVVDTFYVRTSGGAKVVDRDHLREIERAVLHQLAF
jgi:[protein-PII] uridylyltransferase